MAEQTWYGAGGRFHNKIYVGNLSSRTRDDDIRDVFIKYGDVVDIVLKYDFAFVEMENEKDMEEAIELEIVSFSLSLCLSTPFCVYRTHSMWSEIEWGFCSFFVSI